MKFFITGLPRSRTYWFSQYLSSMPRVFCPHELTNIVPPDEFHSFLESFGTVARGTADSGLFITDIETRYPDAPIVIIERPIEDVQASLEAFFERMEMPDPQIETLIAQHEAMADMRGLRIPFDQVDQRMAEIHRHLGLPYDEKHHKEWATQKLEMPELLVNYEYYQQWRDLARSEAA